MEKRVLLLLLVPTETFARHFVSHLATSIIMSLSPRSILFEITLPFSYMLKVSTAGLLASTVHVKFTTIPTQTRGTVDKFVFKEAFSGATVQKKKNTKSYPLSLLKVPGTI